MQWHHPTSSNVHSFAYEPEAKQLHMRFHSGHTYTYNNVPPEVHDGLVNADSVGKYHSDSIKGQFEYKRTT